MSSKTHQIKKANNAAKNAKKGASKRKYKVRTQLRFYKPRTLRVASAPKYQRTKASLKLPAKFDKSSVLINPLTTEKANKAMTERNTLTFLVHPRANKVQIKRAMHSIYGVQPRSVNTLNRPDGKKKAFVTLKPENEAVGVASKMGII